MSHCLIIKYTLRVRLSNKKHQKGAIRNGYFFIPTGLREIEMLLLWMSVDVHSVVDILLQ